MLKISVSTTLDGSMKPHDKDDVQRCHQRRSNFLRSQQILPSETTCVRLEYDGDDYCRYQTIDSSYKGDGILRPSSLIVDGLVVTKPNHALFLTLADCIGTVLHDPAQNILMLTHLGRHNLEQNGGTASVEYLVKQLGVDPKNLTVWLSPAACKKNYPLFAFDGRSLHDIAIEQLQAAGVTNKNITVSPIDTTVDENYYSHSQFLKGRQETDGRFAVVVTMR